MLEIVVSLTLAFIVMWVSSLLPVEEVTGACGRSLCCFFL